MAEAAGAGAGNGCLLSQIRVQYSIINFFEKNAKYKIVYRFEAMSIISQ